MKASLQADVDYIVQLLQLLQYSGVECTDGEWISRLLFERGDARDQLLLWLVRLISPDADTCSEAWGERKDVLELKGVLQLLSSLGLCRPTDADVVSGSAPVPQQLRFWTVLVETACDLSSVEAGDGGRCSRSADLLHTLCTSAAMAHISSCESSSVLPGDLQEKYRAWCRHNKNKKLPALSDCVHDTERELAQTLQQLNEIPKEHHELPDSERLASAVPALASQLDKLNKSGALFSQMYSTHLASWIRSRDAPEDAQQTYGAETGRAVHETYQKLQQLNQALANIKEISKKAEELSVAEAAAQRCVEQPPPVADALRRIAAATVPGLRD